MTPDAGPGVDLRCRAGRLLRGVAASPGVLLDRGSRVARNLPTAGTIAGVRARAGRLCRRIASRVLELQSALWRGHGRGVLPDLRRFRLGWRSNRSGASPTAHASRLDISSPHRLGATIVFSIVVHLILILGVTFAREALPDRGIETLDVVLVPYRSESAPEDPDYLAQTNQDGGGDRVERYPRPSPPPAPVPTGAALVAANEPLTQTIGPRLPDAEGTAQTEPPSSPPRASEIATASGGTGPVEMAHLETYPDEAIIVEATSLRRTRELHETRAAAQPSPEEPAAVTKSLPEQRQSHARDTLPARPDEPSPSHESDSLLRSKRSAELAALSAELERKLEAYSERPRRKWISARTREHRFAAYMDEWRRKVERVGNLNFPDEAAQRRISGDLLLDVALLPDGTVESITLRRSSGERVLDDAAIRIVEIAAPFSKFPRSIADDVDILHIERTWIFRPDESSPPSLSPPHTLR